jgi:hypothetical protein
VSATRRVYLDFATGPHSRIASLVFEVTRDDSEQPASYQVELISGDMEWTDLPDAEAAAIAQFEADLAETTKGAA